MPKRKRLPRHLLRSMLLLLLFLTCAFGAQAQNVGWEPSPGHTQIPIWPGTPPDSQPAAGPETAATTKPDELVAGRPCIYVSNVSRPTMTVYSPQGNNSGAAVVVFPGGGYRGAKKCRGSS
jgi:acetyl esterase/lipase